MRTPVSFSISGTNVEGEAYPISKLLQEVDLDQRLLVKPFFIPYDLDCNQRTVLVVYTSYHLAKAPFSENVHYLVPICEVIPVDNIVIAPFVVVAKVCGFSGKITDMFPGVLNSTEENLLIINNLTALKYVQIRHFQRLCGRDSLFWYCFPTKIVDLLGGLF